MGGTALFLRALPSAPFKWGGKQVMGKDMRCRWRVPHNGRKEKRAGQGQIGQYIKGKTEEALIQLISLLLFPFPNCRK